MTRLNRFLPYLLLCLLLTLGLAGALHSAQPTADPRYPFPQHIRYASGTLRPMQRTQLQQDDDVRAFYDYWKGRYLVSAGTTSEGNTLYRVSFGSSNPERTVSEGQGFGMMIVAHMAGHDSQAQTIFDGLWEFSRRYPSTNDPRLMGWQIPPVGSSNASAFDGDADIAYALLLADQQWGSSGRIDYRAAAAEVMAGVLESTIGPQSHLPMLGDWVNPDGSPHNQYTPRSSDFIPDHFRAFERATSNPVWGEVVRRSQDVIDSIQQNHSPATGLLPDFIVPRSGSDPTPQPAAPYFLEGPNDGSYYYNAGRVPWRLGTDALLNNDARSLAQTRKISRWIRVAAGGVPTSIKPGYQLNGTPIPPGNYFTSFFAAPLGVAAMTDPEGQSWLDAVYETVRAKHENYYEDTVTMLCLLVMTGNYWDPTAASTPPVLPPKLYLPLTRR